MQRLVQRDLRKGIYDAAPPRVRIFCHGARNQIACHWIGRLAYPVFGDHAGIDLKLRCDTLKIFITQAQVEIQCLAGSLHHTRFVHVCFLPLTETLSQSVSCVHRVLTPIWFYRNLYGAVWERHLYA